MEAKLAEADTLQAQVMRYHDLAEKTKDEPAKVTNGPGNNKSTAATTSPQPGSSSTTPPPPTSAKEHILGNTKAMMNKEFGSKGSGATSGAGHPAAEAPSPPAKNVAASGGGDGDGGAGSAVPPPPAP